MTRIRMIEERDQAAASQVEVFDRIVASRGQMLTPFAAMLHRPEIAMATSELGAVLRFQSTLSDHDRELVILTTATERGCAYERDAHLRLAGEAGVDEETLREVLDRKPVSDPSDDHLVQFARGLCRDGGVSDEVFAGARSRLGDEGTVELTVLVGYYSMITLFLAACDAC